MSKIVPFVLVILIVVYLSLCGFSAVDLSAYGLAGQELTIRSVTPVATNADGSLVLDVEGGGFTDDVRVFSHFDVNNRAAIVGSFPIDGMVFDMEKTGDILFVASLVDGLRAFDVSDPLKPVMLPNKYSSNTIYLDIERRGQEFFFSCGGQGVRTAKLSNRGSLKDWKTLPSFSTAVDTAVVGSKLYVAASKAGMLVYDLDQLENYQPLARYEAEQSLRQVEVYERYLYAVYGRDGVWVYRLDEQGLPVKIATLPAKRYVRSITIVEDKLYLLENNRLAKFDLKRPEEPALIAEQNHFSAPQRLYSFGGRVYVADNHSGLGIVNMVDGKLEETASFLNLGGDSRAAVMVDGLLYVGVAKKGINIIDPQKIKPRQVVKTLESTGLVRDFRLLGGYGFIVDSVDGVSYQSLDGPPKRMRLPESEGHVYKTSFITSSQNLFFVSSHNAPFKVFDASDAATLELIAEFEGLRGNPVIQDDYLLLATGATGFELWDISDYASPKRLDSIDDVLATQIAVKNDLLFVAGEREGVGIYRILEGRLKFLSQVQLPFPLSPFSISLKCVVRGNTLFVANGDAGLMIVDVKNPQKPKVLNSLRLPGQASDLMVEGDRVYLLSRYYGLHTIDISNLRNPRLLDSLHLSDVWRGMQRWEDLFYLGNRFMGVTAIPFPEEIKSVHRVSSKKLRITVPKPKYPGRYSLQIGNTKGTVDVEGVVSFP
ncbi:Uncharacterized conserved protein [Malonomonas rubra DSM 5091]|uniref:Uncharacterized conserved protein n=1 Tax=Malonomonas rubra DSM 5091 TaxID=1122189 RepID=A0A1M6BG24_MALRU|nr:hypothetical protein [Malonomonas rubra]SHI47671.1 Uncharacterized conserved protein [Malonomonas rubra DSM 5091]